MSSWLSNAAFLLVLAPLAADRPSRGGPGGEDNDPVYARCLDRAIERAEGALQRQTELWEDHSTWDNAWQVRTEHYVVRTTDSRYLGLDIAQGLESMLGYFTEMLKPGFEPPAPYPVFIVPDVPSYNQMGNDHGAEHSSLYASFYAQAHPEKPVIALYSGNLTELRMRVSHSALHQFVASAFPNATPPAALSEGLASYFSLYWDYDYGVTQLQGLINRKELLPLRELLSANIQQFSDRTHRRMIELGMLFNYLLHHREDTRTVTAEDGRVERAPGAEYLRTVLAGGNAAGSPVHALLTENVADLEADFRAFQFPK